MKTTQLLHACTGCSCYNNTYPVNNDRRRIPSIRVQGYLCRTHLKAEYEGCCMGQYSGGLPGWLTWAVAHSGGCGPGALSTDSGLAHA